MIEEAHEPRLPICTTEISLDFLREENVEKMTFSDKPYCSLLVFLLFYIIGLLPNSIGLNLKRFGILASLIHSVLIPINLNSITKPNLRALKMDTNT